MPETLTIQAYWKGAWQDTGDVIFREPRKGLAGPMQFYYDPNYINNADSFRPGLDFIDERAISVNLPGNFTGHFNEEHIAPALRDMIPQGAGRRSLLKLWGEKDTGPGMDFRLLKEGCIAPIGNLRIKEAAEAFQERVAQQKPIAFSRDDVTERNEELISHAHDLGIAIGGATGAGGDAPKLLLVESNDGQFYLEGTLDEVNVSRHWLVKFPRGRMLTEDEDILRAEGVFYRALSALGINTIHQAEVREGPTPSLWLHRFDRVTLEGHTERFGVESVYSLMGMIGDGARLQHTNVLARIQNHLDGDPDELLVEYLLRDVINTAIGNTDNHGRNTAALKRDGVIQLAPAYDLAPMVLDREAIARTTVWPKHFLQPESVNYAAIIGQFALDARAVTLALVNRLEALSDFRKLTVEMGLPASVLNSPRIHLDRFGQVAEDLRRSQCRK